VTGDPARDRGGHVIRAATTVVARAID